MMFNMIRGPRIAFGNLVGQYFLLFVVEAKVYDKAFPVLISRHLGTFIATNTHI